ncbi:MAG: 3-deoxy-D-manno-octulosonic acid transferase [Crocinitomicaceae bacterium]
MRLFYLLGVKLYTMMVHIASIWDIKAKAWVNGRKAVWEQILNWQRKSELPVYWFHCASLGEFEQGRPVMERLKEKDNCQLIITFFSPSGYEIRKDFELADLVIYLPHESKKNVNRFYDLIQPDKIFFVKYEFWATYILSAHKRRILIYSISAVFRDSQLYFKPWGGYMRKVLNAFDGIFVQDEISQQLLSKIGVSSMLAGDTRYDRVMHNAASAREIPEVASFVDGAKVFVMGSSWTVGEKAVFPKVEDLSDEWKVIIAPHEITASHLQEIESNLKKKTIRYSRLVVEGKTDADVLIIDNIGMLMHLYQYADIAYVGGAFGKGLHNILEPTCFGVPVIFGPKHDKYREASDFIANGIGFSVDNASTFRSVFDEVTAQDLADKIKAFMLVRTGATNIILKGIHQ